MNYAQQRGNGGTYSSGLTLIKKGVFMGKKKKVVLIRVVPILIKRVVIPARVGEQWKLDVTALVTYGRTMRKRKKAQTGGGFAALLPLAIQLLPALLEQKCNLRQLRQQRGGIKLSSLLKKRSCCLQQGS